MTSVLFWEIDRKRTLPCQLGLLICDYRDLSELSYFGILFVSSFQFPFFIYALISFASFLFWVCSLFLSIAKKKSSPEFKNHFSPTLLIWDAYELETILLTKHHIVFLSASYILSFTYSLSPNYHLRL